MSGKKFALKTAHDFFVPLRSDQLLVIRPDRKYENYSHVKTTMKSSEGKNVWFSVRHSVKEILDMYYSCK